MSGFNGREPETFAFITPHRRVDWSRISRVPLGGGGETCRGNGTLERGWDDPALAAARLNSVLGDVLYGKAELDLDFGCTNLSGEEDGENGDANDLEDEVEALKVVKALRVMQFSTQYLTHSQHVLSACAKASQAQLNESVRRLRVQHDTFLVRKGNKRALRRELSRTDDLIARYDATLKVLRPDLAERVKRKPDGSIEVRFPPPPAPVNHASNAKIKPSSEEALDLEVDAEEIDEDFDAFLFWKNKMRRWRNDAKHARSATGRLAVVEQQLRDLELETVRREQQRQRATASPGSVKTPDAYSPEARSHVARSHVSQFPSACTPGSTFSLEENGRATRERLSVSPESEQPENDNLQQLAQNNEQSPVSRTWSSTLAHAQKQSLSPLHSQQRSPAFGFPSYNDQDANDHHSHEKDDEENLVKRSFDQPSEEVLDNLTKHLEPIKGETVDTPKPVSQHGQQYVVQAEEEKVYEEIFEKGELHREKEGEEEKQLDFVAEEKEQQHEQWRRFKNYTEEKDAFDCGENLEGDDEVRFSSNSEEAEQSSGRGDVYLGSKSCDREDSYDERLLDTGEFTVDSLNASQSRDRGARRSSASEEQEETGEFNACSPSFRSWNQSCVDNVSALNDILDSEEDELFRLGLTGVSHLTNEEKVALGDFDFDGTTIMANDLDTTGEGEYDLEETLIEVQPQGESNSDDVVGKSTDLELQEDKIEKKLALDEDDKDDQGEESLCSDAGVDANHREKEDDNEAPFLTETKWDMGALKVMYSDAARASEIVSTSDEVPWSTAELGEVAQLPLSPTTTLDAGSMLLDPIGAGHDHVDGASTGNSASLDMTVSASGSHRSVLDDLQIDNDDEESRRHRGAGGLLLSPESQDSASDIGPRKMLLSPCSSAAGYDSSDLANSVATDNCAGGGVEASGANMPPRGKTLLSPESILYDSGGLSVSHNGSEGIMNDSDELSNSTPGGARSEQTAAAAVAISRNSNSGNHGGHHEGLQVNGKEEGENDVLIGTMCKSSAEKVMDSAAKKAFESGQGDSRDQDETCSLSSGCEEEWFVGIPSDNPEDQGVLLCCSQLRLLHDLDFVAPPGPRSQLLVTAQFLRNNGPTAFAPPQPAESATQRNSVLVIDYTVTFLLNKERHSLRDRLLRARESDQTLAFSLLRREAGSNDDARAEPDLVVAEGEISLATLAAQGDDSLEDHNVVLYRLAEVTLPIALLTVSLRGLTRILAVQN